MEPTTQTHARLNAHKLSEFIYGTVTAMVAVAGISEGHDTSWSDAMLIVVAGAFAIWLAHAYATLMGRRAASGKRSDRADLWRALTDSWPIVTAGVMVSLPLVLAGIGVLDLDAALWACSLVGLVILALVGILAGKMSQETWPYRVFMALLSAGLGFLIVAIEYLVRH